MGQIGGGRRNYAIETEIPRGISVVIAANWVVKKSIYFLTKDTRQHPTWMDYCSHPTINICCVRACSWFGQGTKTSVIVIPRSDVTTILRQGLQTAKVVRGTSRSSICI